MSQNYKREEKKCRFNKQRRIANVCYFAILILFHVCVEDFISYPQTPTFGVHMNFWEQKTETIS